MNDFQYRYWADPSERDYAARLAGARKESYGIRFIYQGKKSYTIAPQMDKEFPPRSHPRLRILIVDDHELVRAGLALLLETRWDVCGEAGNGVEAVEKVRDLKPDLVLLDLSMPVMSGTRAARAIREISPGIKIVFISMHDSPTVVDLAKTVGADGFISKHSNAKEFKAALAALMGQVQ